MKTIALYAFMALISAYVFYHIMGVMACMMWEYI